MPGMILTHEATDADQNKDSPPPFLSSRPSSPQGCLDNQLRPSFVLSSRRTFRFFERRGPIVV